MHERTENLRASGYLDLCFHRAYFGDKEQDIGENGWETKMEPVKNGASLSLCIYVSLIMHAGA